MYIRSCILPIMIIGSHVPWFHLHLRPLWKQWCLRSSFICSQGLRNNKVMLWSLGRSGLDFLLQKHVTPFWAINPNILSCFSNSWPCGNKHYVIGFTPQHMFQRHQTPLMEMLKYSKRFALHLDIFQWDVKSTSVPWHIRTYFLQTGCSRSRMLEECVEW